MKIAAVLGVIGISALAACATGRNEARRSSAESIQRGIAVALNASPLDSYTKNGCLRSLNYWRDEVEKAAPPAQVRGGLFFLGDSYVVANFAYLDGSGGLMLQTSDAIERLSASTTQLAELSKLLVAAHRDGPPQHPIQSTHTTCVVFLDKKGRYFSVQEDTSDERIRATDRAIALLDQLIQGEP